MTMTPSITKKSLICRIGLAALALVILITPIHAQGEEDRWLRVITEDALVVDVDRTSLVVEQEGVFRARFRTSLPRPEAVPGKAKATYSKRLDYIQFNTREDRYRIAESELLDHAGKVVASHSSVGANDWKPLWGRSGNLMLSAASQLRPFGDWKVASYRYASGEIPAADEPPELRSLIGSSVYFKPDQMSAGGSTCRAPMLDARTVTDAEVVRRFGSPLRSLGILSDKIEFIFVRCGPKDKFPPTTIMIRLADNRMMMLWEGVFLELERSVNFFQP